jgi:hypothetical protein
MIDGRALMPAFSIAITKGEEALVPLDRFKPGSLEGTSKPIIMVPPT